MQNLINLIKEEPCIVVASGLAKRKLLSAIDGIYDVTFKSLSDIQNDLCGYYDKISVYKIKHLLNVKYDRAKSIYDSLIIAHDTAEESLASLCKDLEEYYHKPKKYNKRIIVLDNATGVLLKKLNELDNVIFYNYEEINNINVYHFDSAIKEVERLANSICNLIDNNELDIAIYYDDPDYSEIIKEVFPFYNISYNISDAVSLYDVPEIRKFIDACDVNNPIIPSDMDEKLKQGIIEIFNELVVFTEFDKSDLIDALKTHSFINYNKGIRIASTSEFSPLYKHSFVLGCANRIIPRVFKDDKYYSDKKLKELGYEDSFDLNKHQKTFFTNTCKACTNLTITYSDASITQQYKVSPIIEEMGLKAKNIVTYETRNSNEVEMESPFTYSKSRCMVEFDKAIFRKKQYNDIDPMLSRYDENFEQIINTLDSIPKIDNDLLLEALFEHDKNYISLSYSKLAEFLHCPYAFYCDYVLGVKQDSFNNTADGLVIHKFLEEYCKGKKDYTLQEAIDEINKEMKEKADLYGTKADHYDLSRLYYDKINSYLDVLKEAIDEQMIDFDGYKVKGCEEKLELMLEGNINIKLNGVVDKLLAKGEDIIIVDYKTGAKINLGSEKVRNIENEMSEADIKRLQLLMYLKLLGTDYNNFKGVFYERVLPKKKEDLSLGKELYKPYGYRSLNSSETIAYQRCSRNKPVDELSEEEYLANLKELDTHIEEFRQAALEGTYPIKPIKDACKLCQYYNICQNTKEEFTDEEDE